MIIKRILKGLGFGLGLGLGPTPTPTPTPNFLLKFQFKNEYLIKKMIYIRFLQIL